MEMKEVSSLKGCIHVGKVTEFDTDTCTLVVDEGKDAATKKAKITKLKMDEKMKKADWEKILGCNVCLKEVDGVVTEVM
jgi:hypothetical protein